MTWKHGVANKEALSRNGEWRKLQDTIWKRKQKLIRRVLRYPGLVRKVTAGRMEKKGEKEGQET